MVVLDTFADESIAIAMFICIRSLSTGPMQVKKLNFQPNFKTVLK